MKASLKLVVLAASLAAAFISGCAELSTSPAGAGATASAQSDIDTPGNPHSPYPAETDFGIF